LSRASHLDRPLLLAALAALFLAVLMLGEIPRETAMLDPRCDTWDETANAALGAAIAARNRIPDSQLGDAVFRLRRARRNCKAGWLALAQSDYEALLEGRYAGVRTPLRADSRK
jgi:hypothetical protein